MPSTSWLDSVAEIHDKDIIVKCFRSTAYLELILMQTGHSSSCQPVKLILSVKCKNVIKKLLIANVLAVNTAFYRDSQFLIHYTQSAALTRVHCIMGRLYGTAELR
jgi:hypothetical protein